ncbi:uncharacterized protein EV422DRAFT_613057 [Fimicolochytrium jonesii]|uniref:uncharacterized protein n=1 Tax=Fimicolochytrium jonesii TaxID=1396493 RepID=UPI0022FE4AC7|nr:uncharacterized protein EV422DRAFT_613057 [Fimicolochytrium jonesii]KAI8823053.1 hypothetical protein EV422DRAFT_613057 [Fimicolochytrium jonesii]
MGQSDGGQNGSQQDLGEPAKEGDNGGKSREPRPGAVRVLKRGNQERYSAGCIDCRVKSSSKFHRSPWPVLARAEGLGRHFFFGEGATEGIVCAACWKAWRRIGVFRHESPEVNKGIQMDVINKGIQTDVINDVFQRDRWLASLDKFIAAPPESRPFVDVDEFSESLDTNCDALMSQTNTLLGAVVEGKIKDKLHTVLHIRAFLSDMLRGIGNGPRAVLCGLGLCYHPSKEKRRRTQSIDASLASVRNRIILSEEEPGTANQVAQKAMFITARDASPTSVLTSWRAMTEGVKEFDCEHKNKKTRSPSARSNSENYEEAASNMDVPMEEAYDG